MSFAGTAICASPVEEMFKDLSNSHKKLNKKSNFDLSLSSVVLPRNRDGNVATKDGRATQSKKHDSLRSSSAVGYRENSRFTHCSSQSSKVIKDEKSKGDSYWESRQNYEMNRWMKRHGTNEHFSGGIYSLI